MRLQKANAMIAFAAVCGLCLAEFSYSLRVKLVSKGSDGSFVSVGAAGILSHSPQRMIVPGSRWHVMIPPITAQVRICQFKGVVARLQPRLFNWKCFGIELTFGVYFLWASLWPGGFLMAFG